MIIGVLLLCSTSDGCSEHTNHTCSGGDVYIIVSKEDHIQVW